MAAVAAEYARVSRDDETTCAAMPSLSEAAADLGADTDRVDRLVAGRLATKC
jgi:hypothetical protein